MPNKPNTPAAILCPLSGAYLMEASAGTGKTWTLTGILLRLLVQKKVVPESIVATTFTRAAAQEIYERLNLRLLDFANLMEWLAAHGELLAGDQDNAQACLSFAPDALSDPLLGYLFEWVRAGGHQRLAETQKRLALAQLNLDKLFVGTLDALAQKWLGEFFDQEQDEQIVNDTQSYTYALTHDALRQIQAEIYYDCPALVGLIDDKDFELTALVRNLGAAFEFVDVPVCHAPSLDVLVQQAHGLQEDIERLTRCDFSAFAVYFDEAYRTCQGMKKNNALTKHFHHLPTVLSKLSLGIEGLLQLENDAKKLVGSFGEERVGVFNKNHDAQEQAWRSLDVQLLVRIFELYERALTLKDELKSALIAKLILQVRQNLPKLLAGQKQTSFFLKMHSLIDKLSAANGKHIAQHIRHLYPVALIDEAQDLNNAQARLLAQIYLSQKPSSPKQFLLVVGDPKQAIYRFRGGDVANYLYLKSLGLDTSFGLNVNQRTHLALVHAMNAWFGDGYDALGEAIMYEPVDAKKTQPKYDLGKSLAFLHLKDSDADRFDLVVRHVCTLLGEGIPACDVAVLVAANKDVELLQKLFGLCGVPTKTSQSPSVFLSRACQDLAGVFLAVLTPETTKLLAVLTNFFAYDFESAQAILADDQKKGALLLYLSLVYQAWQNKGASFAFEALMARHPFEEYSVWEVQAGFVDAQGYLSDLWQLFDVLAGFDGTIASFLGHLEAQKKDKDHPIVHTDEVGVTISTMHKSKGLEFSVVYVLDLYKMGQSSTQVYFYHDNHERKLSVKAKVGEQDFAQKDKQEALDEKKRLGYVALTRAADKLYVVVQDLKRRSDNPMAYWGFLPDGTHFSLPERLFGHADWIDADVFLQQKPVLTPLVQSLPLPVSDWQQLYPKCVFDGVYRTSFSALSYRLKKPSPYQTESYQADPKPDAQILSVADYDDSDVLTESLPDTQDIRSSWRRGVVGGSFLHAVLQNMARRSPVLAVQDACYEQNFVLSDDAKTSVANWLQEVLDEPFAASKAVYWQLGVCQHELGFVLGDFANTQMQPLVQIFNDHSPFELHMGYDNKSYGYLCGSIDLVYEHCGRFYVVDFKSNYLGADCASYDEVSMSRAMSEHHYWLQAALYQLALHRFLKVRLIGYMGNEDKHLGAVEFVFLRGAGQGGGMGRLVWEVPLSLVLAMDEFLGSGQ